MTLKNFFFPRFDHNRVSIALLLLRIVAGIAMILHGWDKIQNPMAWQGPDSTTPGFLQLLAAVSEFGGGIAWVIGLLTPLASFGIACTMAVATYFHAVVLGQPFVGREGSYELALIYFMIAVLFMTAGPGKYSLDDLIRNRRRS